MIWDYLEHEKFDRKFQIKIMSSVLLVWQQYTLYQTDSKIFLKKNSREPQIEDAEIRKS